MSEPTKEPSDDQASRERSEDDRMHEAVERYLDAERANRGWRWDAWVVERFGYAGLMKPLRPSATDAERRAWIAERDRRQRIDLLVIGAMVLLFIGVVVVFTSGGGSDDGFPGNLDDPQPLVIPGGPTDGAVLPSTVPDGHGGVIHFGG